MSDFNIVVAHFGHHNRVVMTDTLYQYDYGQKLKVEGITALPQTFQAHFSNVQHGGVSITVTGINGMVDVPNSLLMTGKRIYCWIYVTETGSGETVYQILMPVQSRPMPEYYDVEDVGVFDSVVNQVAEYAATATTGATSATASATAAAGSETAAAASASAAADSAENAAASETNAEASASAAQASDASAATAATTATTKAAEAAQSATSAGSAADRAEAAQEAAETAQTAAGNAASGAGQAAGAAGQYATSAGQSASRAETAASTAEGKASEATFAAGQAVEAETEAISAKNAAQVAESNATNAATTATAKATEAAANAAAAAQAAASINTPDSALSDTSTNAVQNKVITGEVAQVKSALDALKITDTASGAVASFSDGAAMPMESLTVEMSPIQDLHGQDSPYPAGGGKNLFDPSAATVGVNWNGSAFAYSIASDYIPVAVGETYTLSVSDMPKFTGVVGACLDADKVYKTNTSNMTFTVPADTAFVRISFRCASDQSWTDSDLSAAKIQLEKGSSASAWSPYENICPISGRESVTVVRTGVNVWDEEWEVGLISVSNGQNVTGPGIRSKNYSSCKPSTGYRFVFGSGTTKYAFWYDADHNYISNNAVTDNTVKFTSPPNAMYFRLRADTINTYNNDFSVNYPSTDHDYHAYDGQSATIQLGQTVYGGTVDVTTGVMTVDRAYFEMQTAKTSDWQKSSSYPGGFYIGRNAFKIDGIALKDNTPFLCSHAKSVSRLADYVYGTCYCDSSLNFRLMDGSATVSDWVAYLQEQKNNGTPVVACGLLATPLTIPLTAQQMSTIKGQNNVWSDTDSVTVEYVADPKLYIARLTEPDADMVADANIVNGQYFMVNNTLYLATANIASGATIVPGVNCTRTNLASALNAINS